MTNPLNLVGRVQIKSADQALEYVRFFTSPELYSDFELGGTVEIQPGKVMPESSFNVAEQRKFDRFFKVPSAESLKGSSDEFVIRRALVSLDQQAYEIVEIVRSDGYYDVASRKRVTTAS